jgi:hypothetical protein
MELTFTEPCLHDKLESDGCVTYGIYLSNECPDDGFEDALEAWLTGEESVYINYRFSIRECIEDSISFRKLHNVEGLVVKEGSRPVFDALRAELIEAVARLDEIRYES